MEKWGSKMNYNEIFDFESKKILDLFTLLNGAREPYSIDDLSKKLNIDPKTISKYIKKINKLILTYQLDSYIKIVIENKNQLYMKKDNELYAGHFRTEYLSSLPEIIFLKLVIENKSISTNDFAKELAISESSLRRKIRKINEWLSQIDLQLKRGTYELLGEEERIRAFILNFYWFLYQETPPSFLNQTRLKSKRMANQVLTFFQLQINEIQKETIVRIIQISCWRFQLGKRMKVKRKWRRYITDSPVFSGFCDFLWQQLSFSFLTIDELSYLYLILQANFLPYYGKQTQSLVIQEHFQQRTSCYENTLLVTDTIKQTFWEKEFEYTQGSLAAFLSFHLYYELMTNYTVERELSVYPVKKNYPIFSKKLEECLKKVSLIQPMLKEIPKTHQFRRYFMILTSLISPIAYEKKFIVCIMTDLSIEKEQDIGRQITYFFYEKVNLSIMYARTSKSIIYADVILTTKIHQKLFKKYKRPIIVFDASDFQEIFSKIEKIIEQVQE